MEWVNHEGISLPIYRCNTLIVGTGAASLKAANVLYDQGQEDIAILSEGIHKGTSRNTGSDKQTYYRLSPYGEGGDSVHHMAQTLYDGGAMDGDIALVEAALSTKAFYKLIDLGVPFPHNTFGEYIGYKTDHDSRKRGTSAGPLTSRYMTEGLEDQVKRKGIRLYDGYQVIQVLKEKNKAIGVLAIGLDKCHEDNNGLILFNCTNIIYGTGGPASIYRRSVYPRCQTGATGIALEAGVQGVNLTEWQYGLASVGFRWNVSGTYQQVLPRYISTDQRLEEEREFLTDYFHKKKEMLDAIFLKGYQWPFDPRKLEGSSIIDLLVYEETQLKGRRVFLDYTRNPSGIRAEGPVEADRIGGEAFAYLSKSNALEGTPIQRLEKMNQPAIMLYRAQGIDLRQDYLEIDVCAQHHNGGLQGNIWWESNLKHFFPIGEACGSLGVYRPGGSALNSTQVAGERSAQYIGRRYREAPMANDIFLTYVKEQLSDRFSFIERLRMRGPSEPSLEERIAIYQDKMTKVGAFIRREGDIQRAIEDIRDELDHFHERHRLENWGELGKVFHNYNTLITQLAILSAMEAYRDKGGASRGSYLISDSKGEKQVRLLNEQIGYSLDDKLKGQLCETRLDVSHKGIGCMHTWRNVHPIPESEGWFEKVWDDYRKGMKG